MKIIGNRKPAIGNFTGFTLIELLVVISIIAVLAALTIPVLSAVKALEYKKVAQGELGNLETALENYKAKYGAYPPSNKNPGSANYDPAILNQLYYELSGVTRDAVKNTFTTLDGATTISANDYKAAFGVDGVENCTQGGGEDGISAKNFLPGLKQNQISDNVSNNLVRTTMLITSVGGPDDGYRPLDAAALNPFRYNSTNPTNNPGSYDLWIDLRIGGKTNRISNWSRQVQILK
jgi:prepilin-type N-terminal cleavage/methylation domain-containing protein